MDTRFTVRIPLDGDVLAVKQINGVVVAHSSMNLFTLADEIRSLAVRIQESEALKQIMPNRLYFRRGVGGEYFVTHGAPGGIVFHQADKHGTVLSDQPASVFPLCDLLLVRNQPASFAA